MGSKKMNIIVTGGAGFVGSNLVDKLVARGDKVCVVDNLSTGKMENINKAAEFVEFDIRGEWSSIDFEPDLIYHIAALARIQPSFGRPHETISANCQGTVRVLDYAVAKRCRLVYAGSSSFYFDPHASPYSHSKWIGEEHCRMYNKVYGVSAAIARFFNVYGPRHVRTGSNANVLGIFEDQKIRNVPLTITGNGEQLRDFTHVDDICSGLMLMGDSRWNGEVFNLGRSHNYSINEVAAMFEPVGMEYLPARAGEAKSTLADISFSKSRLRWEPKVNLPDYVGGFLKGIGGK